jgi:phosphatidylinositol alpha-mannosyltransferase
VTFLGQIDDPDKAAMLRTADVYVAPNTGGESFGIVLAEAMAAGTAVLASDLPAFSRVLDGGRAGVLVPVENPDALGAALARLLAEPGERDRLRLAATAVVRRYDWSRVARDILAVYETVTEGAEAVRAVEEDGPGRLARLWNRSG